MTAEPRQKKRTKTCENCIFWHRVSDVMNNSQTPTYSIGDCRKMPPVVLSTPTVVTRWPETKSFAWCGQHCGKPMEGSLERF